MKTEHLGIGVLIGMLAGNKSTYEAVQASLGRTIKEMKLDDNRAVLEFQDGSFLRLRDAGQSCCEHRYMVCDDDLAYHAGAKLLDFELAEGPTIDEEYGGAHEQQFLRVKTDRGVVVFSNHNEHNGYYGGFLIDAELTEAK